MTARIIFDTDPGHDDVMALMVAARSPGVELLAVTTVAGNQTLDKTTYNALAAMEYLGISGIPVAAGCARPLYRDRIIAPAIHGESGLDGVTLPAPTRRAVQEHAVDLIGRICLEEGNITIVPVGPLTNIAMALLRYPDLAKGVKEIVLMGGSVTHGNRTPAAEFNIVADPEAAKVVFRSGIPITMVGLNVTLKALATDQVLERLKEIGTRASRLFHDMVFPYAEGYRRVYGIPRAPVHDAVAVAQVVDRAVLDTKRMFVDVETQGELTYGQTVCDVLGVMKQPANVDVALQVHEERLWDVICSALARYGA